MKNLVQSLDGIWQFTLVPEVWEKLDFNALIFADRQAVPGCFDANRDYLGRRGTGVYRRSFECEAGIQELVIGAMGLAGAVQVDGVEVARLEHPYLRTVIHFEAAAGEHELQILADNHFGTEERPTLFYEYYDFYGFGGIYDHVTLETVPAQRIESLQVTPLDAASGLVRIRIAAAGVPEQGATAVLAFDCHPGFEVRLAGAETEFECRVPQPQSWTPEQPFLHTLTAALAGREIRTRFGLRVLSWQGGTLRLNGELLKLIGYNRHESHPEFGAATPEFLILDDLRRIKRQGCNFIRGSHYPQREFLLDCCDELGLLVWEESTGWQNTVAQFDDPEFHRQMREQTAAMVRKSFNHPSVILWGFLNECHSNQPAARPMLAELVELIHRLDPSRPVTFATMWGEQECCLDLFDVASFNIYPGWYSSLELPDALDTVVPRMREILDFAARPEYRDKPLIISEIGAAAILGEHDGFRWSEDYQSELIERVVGEVLGDARYTGLAIWQYCNIRSYLTTVAVMTRSRGFNNKGLLDEYRRPKMAWNTVAKLLNGVSR